MGAGGKSARSRTTAPGQLLGYSLQISRLFERLLDSAPGDVVSVEVLGDVAVQTADGEVTSEELKSRTSAANPVADRAVDLWKTVANWIAEVEAGRLDPALTRFVIYTSREYSGNLLAILVEATTPEAALDAWNQALRGLDSSDSEQLAKYYDRLRSADQDLAVAVVRRMFYEHGSGRSVSDIKNKIARLLVPTELIDDVLNQGLGWTKATIDTALEECRPAAVAYDDLHSELTSFVRKINRDAILRSLASDPSPDRVRRERERIYVRQLQIVNLPDDDVLDAVTDYLKAEVDRVEWAKSGQVHETSFDELEKDIIAAWKTTRRVVGLECANAPEDHIGQLLYSRCADRVFTVQQMHAPSHFSRGSFHALADDLRLGWHPRYEEILGAAGEE